MKLSSETLNALQKLITGDATKDGSKLTPYRTGPALVSFFNDFGFSDAYGGGFPSRWVYCDGKLRELNGGDRIAAVIEASIDPRVFIGTTFTAQAAVEHLNEYLRFDGYQVHLVGNRFRLATVTDDRAQPAVPAARVQDLPAALEARGFRLLDTIGRGRSGTVVRARQVSLDRDVAVKCFDGFESMRDEKLKQRFIHEARLLALVQHPAIPYVLTTGTAAGVPYTIMQYVDGQPLREALQTKRRFEVPEAARVARTVLQALSHAHEKRIVHRDVKPENILLSATGSIYLIDFSIGAALEQVAGLTRVTGQDNTPGSIDYMAPEVLNGEPWDHRVDLFAVGVVLYESLAGRRCSTATLDTDLVGLPPDVAKIVATACAANPSERFSSAQSFAEALAKYTERQWDRGAPGTALCVNWSCSAASWRYGYEPATRKNCTDRHCRACGSELAFPCDKCGRPYDGGRYCPGCGSTLYEIPTCQKCGASLSSTDATRDTAVDGCSQCEIPF